MANRPPLTNTMCLPLVAVFIEAIALAFSKILLVPDGPHV